MALNVKNRTLFTGDNLDVMRGMNAQCVDLIYLDPPFNSNRDYAASIGPEAAGAAFEGNCAGCGIHFPFRNLTVDHVVPRSRGGTDHLANLQLLCGACNSMKGTISQAAFHAKLTKQGLR